MDRIDTTIDVETPERVAFRYRVAGPGVRMGALLIDVVLQTLVIVLGTVVLVMGVAITPFLSGLSGGVAFFAWFLLSWFYAATFEYVWSGRTPGKWAMGIRVVQADGAPITLVGAVLRNLMRAVDGLPLGYAVGAMSMFADDRMRRLGDLLAGTVVVVEQRMQLLAPIQVPPFTDEERLSLPTHVVLTREERRAVEPLLRRASSLGDARAEEIAEEFAPTLRERFGMEGHTALRTLQLAWARSTGWDE